MIRWTGLALWEVEISFPGSLTSTFLPRYKGVVLSNPVPIDKVMKLVEDAVNEIKIDSW